MRRDAARVYSFICRPRLAIDGQKLLNERLEIFQIQFWTCYNANTMTGKMRTEWLLHAALGLMLLVGLFPMPIMSMQAWHMPASARAEHNSPTACCNDTIGSLVITCGVLIPYCEDATLITGTQRVAGLPLFIPITYRKITTPPPKI